MSLPSSTSSSRLRSPLLDDHDPSLNVPFEPAAATTTSANGITTTTAADGTSVRVYEILKGVVMQNGAAPGEYVSRQRARETSNIKVLGCLRLKHMMLLFICFLTFGSYWVYDQPGALEAQFKVRFNGGDGKEGSYDDEKNANLYSVYSYPNTVLPFFSGALIDRYLGVRLGALLFLSFIVIGDALFALGVQTRIYGLALVGRLIFGFGGESLTVAQNTYIVRWFADKEMAFAFGLVLAFARVGTSVNFVVSPILADSGVPLAVWFGLGMCLLSMIVGILASITDKWGENQITNERRVVLADLTDEQRTFIAEQDELSEPKNDEVNIRDVLKFPLEAWLLFFVCLFFYIGVLTFYTVAQNFFVEMKNTLTGDGTETYSSNTADLFISIPSFVSIVASPFFGWCVDRTGRALYWVITAALSLLLAHYAFVCMAADVSAVQAMTPVPLMLWIGVFYAMGAAAIWPTLSYILDPKVLGTGYGTMTAVQNAGLAIFPQIIAKVQNSPSVQSARLTNTMPSFIFMLCEIIAVVLALILVAKDAKSGGRLNATAEERALIKAQRSAEQEQQRADADAATV